MQTKSSRGVQLSEVWAAADTLLAKGARPTIERVRHQLGRGSPNTVGPMLEAWFAGLASRLGAASDQPNGSDGMEIPPDFRQAMHSLWHQALDLARMDAQAALGVEREILQAQQQRLIEERAVLTRESAAMKEREALQNAALVRAQRQADELTQQLRELQNTLQHRDDELGAIRLSLSRSVEAKDKAHLEHQKALQGLAEDRRLREQTFRATERRLLQEVDRARQEAKAAQKILSDSEASATADRKLWEARFSAANEEVQSLKTEAATLRASLAAAEKHLHDLRRLATTTRTPSGAKQSRRTKAVS